MSGIPNVKVELLLAGTWVDVSTYVAGDRAPLTCKRGRSSRFDACVPGSASITFNNETGYFTPNTTGLQAANSLSTTTSFIVPYTQIRFTLEPATLNMQVWQGYVDQWSAQVSGSDGSAFCVVSCTDFGGVLTRTALGPYGVEQAAYQVGTSAFTYPLDGSTTLGNSFQPWRVSGGAPCTLVTPPSGSGTFTFASDAPPFLAGSLSLAPSSLTYGPYVKAGGSFNPASGAGGMVACWYKSTFGSATPYAQTVVWLGHTSGATGSLALTISAAGVATLTVTSDSGTTVTATGTGGPDCNDGAWHYLMGLVSTDEKSISLFADNYSTAIASASASAALTISATNRVLLFGAQYQSSTYGVSCVTGEIACASWSAFESAGGQPVCLGVYSSGMFGDASSSLGSISSAYASFPWSSGLPTPNGTITTSYAQGWDYTGDPQLNGKDVWTTLAAYADADRGQLYVDRLGNLYMRGGAARTATLNEVFYDSNADLDGTAAFTVLVDNQLFNNTILATSPGWSIQVDDSGGADTVATLGPMTEQWSCFVSGASLAAAAVARLNARTSTAPRLGQVVVDLMTCTDALESSVLQVAPLDTFNVTFSDTPTATALGASYMTVVVEGWTLTAGLDAYTVALDTSAVG